VNHVSAKTPSGAILGSYPPAGLPVVLTPHWGFDKTAFHP
jgi:hypothetical protein